MLQAIALATGLRLIAYIKIPALRAGVYIAAARRKLDCLACVHDMSIICAIYVHYMRSICPKGVDALRKNLGAGSAPWICECAMDLVAVVTSKWWV